MQPLTSRFGVSTPQRHALTSRLIGIYELAQATEKLERFIVFGSYITSKPVPNDVDIVLVMRDDFNVLACDNDTKKLFDHVEAQAEFRASVFWIRPSLLFLITTDEFIVEWQIKRDRTRRGIVEVTES